MLILPLKTPASRIGLRLPQWLRICLPMQETCRRCGFDSWVGKIPWARKWQPTTYSCLENSMDGGVWQAVVHGISELDTTEHTRTPCVGHQGKEQRLAPPVTGELGG